jgi:3-oxoacyl-[acyl-carrier-protein] synthase III
MTFYHGRIAAIASVVGSDRHTLGEDSSFKGSDSRNLAKLKELMGLDERYVASQSTTAGDLCSEAAEQLFSANVSKREEIGAVIMVTQTPDYIMPATAAVIHGKLGLPGECAAFDVNLGSSGYVYGLWLAFQMVETGSVSKVLLLGGDTLDRLASSNDKATGALFGDAGSATIVERAEGNSPSFFSVGTDGKSYRHLIVPAGGFRQPKTDATRIEQTDSQGNRRSPEHLYMDGSAIFAFSTIKAPAEVKRVLAAAGEEIANVDYLLFHQANKYIISTIMRGLQLPLSKTPYQVVEKYGNLSVASIPVSVCEVLRDEIMRERKRVILCGFGVGLSWATCLLDLENVFCSRVTIFESREA